MNSDTALLVIDVQVGMFPESDPVHNPSVLLENIKNLIAKARFAGVPVVYVQHNAGAGKPLEPGTRGWEIHPEIRSIEGDVLIQKTTPDSFHKTNLHQELSTRNIKRIVLTGIQTELCVDTTCRRASSLGYGVTLAKDAHSTWSRGNLDAAQIIEHHNSLLCWFANVQETSLIQW